MIHFTNAEVVFEKNSFNTRLTYLYGQNNRQETTMNRNFMALFSKLISNQHKQATSTYRMFFFNSRDTHNKRLEVCTQLYITHKLHSVCDI